MTESELDEDHSAEERASSALEAAEVGTWTWDMASGTTTWDERLEGLHGLGPGGFGGTFEAWMALLHPLDRNRCLETVNGALADPGPYTLLHRTIWSDGSVHWIECRGTVVVDDAGSPTGTTGVALDVTAREQRSAAVRRELEAEHRLTEMLQQALLPSSLPQVPGVKLAVRYLAASGAEIGGDWYAVVPLSQDRLGLAIGDVAGHGIPAVVDMANARFSLRALAMLEDDPGVVLERLNQVIRLFEGDAVVTALYGVIDPEHGRWSFANAGHYPALLRHADGRVEILEAPPNAPLGAGNSYPKRHVRIHPGSTLVLYTDGLIERRTEPIGTGIERLVAACRDAPDDPEAHCDHLLERLLEDETTEDDVAVMVATLTRESLP